MPSPQAGLPLFKEEIKDMQQMIKNIFSYARLQLKQVKPSPKAGLPLFKEKIKDMQQMIGNIFFYAKANDLAVLMAFITANQMNIQKAWTLKTPSK
jgi:hypothetical protein